MKFSLLVLTSLLAFSAFGAAPPPANDDFANRIALISSGSIAINGKNASATTQALEPTVDGDVVYRSVWWSWTAPFTGPVTISTKGSSFDTLLGIFTGTALGALTSIAENDDSGVGAYTSVVNFNAQAGIPYVILVGGVNGAGGKIQLRITVGAGPCTYAVSPTSKSFAAAGGSGTVTVTTTTGCTWAMVSNDSFITLTSGSTGSGSGTAAYLVAENTDLTARVGTMTIAGTTVTITQGAALACIFAFSPSSTNATPSAVTNTVAMVASSGCAWTATPNGSWIMIASGASGTGSGTITYILAANSTVNQRTGTITAAGQTFTITQAGLVPCSYSISPTSGTFAAAGGTGNVAISTAGGCAWTASSPVTWVTFSTTNGTGNATVTYSVAANTNTVSRSTTLTVAGQPYALSQSGAACSYSLTPTSVSVGATNGSSSVAVVAGTGCTWTAVANDPWLTITVGTSGTGSGTINFTYAANVNTAIRAGTLTVGGQTFTVNQAAAACIYTISPTAAHYLAVGGTGSIAVTAGAGCAWTAVSNAAWLTVDSGTPGTASGTIGYTVAANATTVSRTGTITAAGSTFTVTQDGTVPCTYSITPTTASFTSTGGTGTIAVTANAGCTWSVSSAATWLTFTPASGSGNGTVTYTVAANTSSLTRTGTLIVAGNTLTVTQTGIACVFSISPTTATFGPVGSTATIAVTATAGCNWSVSVDVPWISIINGASGTGSGTVTYLVANNTNSFTRTGRITAAGKLCIVTQTGVTCSYSISPSSLTVDGSGGNGSVAITASDPACTWTATTSFPWLSVFPASGTGNGTVSFTAASTTLGTSRVGTLIIAGITFTVTQLGDTTAPTVVLTAPLDGTTLTNVASLTATATDDVSVSRVEFYVDGSLLGTDIASPFSLPVNTTNLLSATAANAITAVSTWTTRHNPSESTCRTVCWAPELGLWIGPSDTPYPVASPTNVIQTSPDGITWTRRSAPTNEWEGVCWSPELHLCVAVAIDGTGNRVMTSPDGITWTSRTSAADWSWLSVCWSPELSLFVAVASFATTTGVMTSPDGITWTSRNSASNQDWAGVCWSPALGLFVAVAETGVGTGVMTSTNGITWTTRTPASDQIWTSVCWSPELALFVAVAASGTGNRVMTSPNGTTWTSRTSAANNQWLAVAWSPGLRLFVAVADTGTGNRVMSSPDGITWTLRSSASDLEWAALAWSPKLGQFCALADIQALDGLTNRVMTSVNTTNGTHAFYAKAFDPAGNAGFSGTNYVTVFNTTVSNTNTWVQRFGGTGSDAGNCVAVDSSGNVYLGATFSGTVLFGTNTFVSAGGRDIILAKFDSGGTLLWAEAFGSTGDEFPTSIVLDSSFNIYLGGYFFGSGNFGGATLTSAGGLDFWLARYNSTGVHQWSERFGGTTDEAITSICLDLAQTNVLATGHFQGTVNFGPTTITSADNGIDTFLCKYDAANGNPAWAKSFSNRGYDSGIAVMTDSGNNVILAGYFATRIDLGNGLLFGAGTNGQSDIYLAKYPPSAVAPTTATWQKRYGGVFSEVMGAAAIDSSGDIVTGGTFTTSTDLGGGTITGTSTGNDMFLAKYSGSTGAFVWQRGLLCSQGGAPTSIAFDSTKQPVMIGSFFGSVNFAGTTLASAGSQDIFTAKYTSAGVLLWAKGFGGSSGDSGAGIALGSDDYPVATGAMAGSANFGGTILTSAGLNDIFLLRLVP